MVRPTRPQFRFGQSQRCLYIDIHAPDKLTYDDLKQAILERYKLTPEAYRRKFRGHSCSEHQSFKEANDKLAYLFDKWVETSNIPKTYEGLREMMLMDQAYRRISYELSQYVQEREPSTLTEMGTLADKRVDMKGRKWLASITNSDQKHQKRKRPTKQPEPGNDGKQKGKIKCFNCGEEVHTKPQCTKPKKQNQDKKEQAGQGHNGATPKPAFLCDSVMQEETH